MALSESWEGSGSHPGGSGQIERNGRSWDSPQEGWEKSVGPPRGVGAVGRLFWKAERGQEGDWRGQQSHPEGWEGWEYPQEGREDWEVHQ